MPRHSRVSASVLAADQLARFRVTHARVPGAGPLARFRVGGDEENLTRAERALGVLYGTLHGEWQTIRCGGVELERDASAAPLAPRLIFFRVDRVAGLSEAARAKWGSRAGWFQRKESKDRSRLFTKIPEPPVEGPEVDEVIGVLSAALKNLGTEIMSILGRTQTMSYGFHTAATFEQALASFTEDGYEIHESSATLSWPGATWPASAVADEARDAHSSRAPGV